MQVPKKIAKPLATVLNSTYARAMQAREAVEHRMASMPRQEDVVRQWQEDPVVMAATHYPDFGVSSYPVQNRMQQEFETLERYRTELPERLKCYAAALQAIDQTVEDVLISSRRASPSWPTVPWPSPPKVLRDDPWPSDWPQRPQSCDCEGEDGLAYTFDTNRLLPPPRPSSATLFTLNIADHEVELESLYEEGVNSFRSAFEDYLYGLTSSRWPAIIEVIRCGICWPDLDRYLAESSQPWLPRFFVDETFGLRGTLNRRDELADLMAEISPDAGRWYLSTQPMRYRIENFGDVDQSILEELMAVGLVRWGPDMPIHEMLREIPFSEVKLLFLLAGSSPPRGFDSAVARFGELLLAHGEDYLKRRIRKFVDPSAVIEVREIDGWHREERLGPRARANVLVSTLILLNDGDPEALQVIAGTLGCICTNEIQGRIESIDAFGAALGTDTDSLLSRGG